MIGKANQQVNPKIAALVILALLVVIQVIWWRGLVMRVTTPARGGPMGGSGGTPGPPAIVGSKEVSVTTLAGAPDPGDVDGPGYRARFDSPVGIAVDSQGNLYIADSRNNRIRRVTPQGKTTTVAGSVAGKADGAAAAAQFYCPCGVAVAPDGTIFVADTGNDRICRIKEGWVTTIVGTSLPDSHDDAALPRRAPCALAYLDQPTPRLLIAEALSRRLVTVDLAGKPISERAISGTPLGVSASDPGTVASGRGGMIDPAGHATNGMEIDLEGNEGIQKDFTVRQPVGFCAAPGGRFVIDAEHSAVFYVARNRAAVIAGMTRGRLRTADWRDSDGEKAKFGRIGGIVADGHGLIYVTDTSNNCIRRITAPKDLASRLEAQR